MTDKILFCKITPMKYYKIRCEKDPAPYISPEVHVGEQYNFKPVNLNGEKICHGYFEHRMQHLHIENISGYENLKNANSIDDRLSIKDVLVVWCTSSEDNSLIVAGWYKNATAYYDMQEFCDTQQLPERQWYYVTAKAKDCVLLPNDVRNKWKLPEKFTFGERFVRFINDSEYTDDIKNLINDIHHYGENWIDKYPD